MDKHNITTLADKIFAIGLIRNFDRTTVFDHFDGFPCSPAELNKFIGRDLLLCIVLSLFLIQPQHWNCTALV
jgi:hypothetical protein